MKLVMTVLVRDNSDLIEHHIRYHLAQGVDFFVVTDNGSVDGSREILERFRQQGVMHIIDEPEDTFSQNVWVTRMSQYAHETLRADWIIHSDADEFWWTEPGTLRDLFSEYGMEIEQVSAERKNFLPSANPRAPFWEQMIYREIVSLNASGYPLPSKVAHRARSGVVVGMGNHTIPQGFDSEIMPEPALTIFHFPYISFEQLQTKIRLGGAALERNTSLPPQAAYTWRELFSLYKENKLEDWYQSIPKLETHGDLGVTEGKVVVDTRLRDFMMASARPHSRLAAVHNSN
jgi:hypothetical protein